MIIKKAKDNQIIKLFSGTNRSSRNYSYLINFLLATDKVYIMSASVRLIRQLADEVWWTVGV